MTSTRVAGLVLGAGLGGFVDGIVIHQLLEWHHMLSGWRPLSDPANMAVNMRADALFHLGCLVLTTVGVLLLGRAPRVPTIRLTGLLLAGWGVFNIVEGTIDHLVLGVHHVRHGPHELAWDLGFLGLGAALVAIGLWLAVDRSSGDRTVRVN